MKDPRPHRETGSIMLAACLNAVGVPPLGLTPFKRVSGRDFVRISLGDRSLDGEHITHERFAEWNRGKASAAQPGVFPSLMVWAKTRCAIRSAAEGKGIVLGTIGGRPAVLKEKESGWADGDVSPVRMTWRGTGFDCPGLTAALILSGVKVEGVRVCGGSLRVVLDQSSFGSVVGAGDMAMSWPELPEEKESLGAYFAAAEQARDSILNAIHGRRGVPRARPRIFVQDGSASAIIDQQKLEEGDQRTLHIARKIL